MSGVEPRPSFQGDVLSQHSFGEALGAAARLFSSSDTKWPDFLVPTAQEQLVDDLIRLSLHLRRVVETSSKKVTTKISPILMGLARDDTTFETDLWVAINRVVHHHRLTPKLFTQGDFYRAGNVPMAGHLIADIEVESDRGSSLVNIAGFAVACVNELGAQSVTPRRVFD